MYYKLVSGVDFFELNPGLLAVAGFKDLTDMQMKYICLVCDPSHDNPVRTLQGKTKKEKAVLLAGYKLEPDGKRLSKNARDIIDGKIKNIEDGLQTFKSLHYDEKTDTYESVTNQIGEIRDFLKLKKDNDPRKLKQAIQLGRDLPELIEAKQKLEHLLNIVTTLKPELDSTYTIADVPEALELPTPTEGEDQQSILDQFMKTKRTT